MPASSEWIQLTEQTTNRPISIQIRHIASVRYSENESSTVIRLAGGNFHRVNESHDDVMELIEIKEGAC